MIGSLIIAICILTLIQRSVYRVAVGLCVAIPTIVHWALFDDLSGETYYHSAALADLLSIVLINNISKPSKFSFIAVKIMASFIFVHISGYVIYSMESAPVYYNYICAVLFSAMILLLISKDRSDARVHPILGGYRWLCSNWNSSYYWLSLFKKAAR